MFSARRKQNLEFIKISDHSFQKLGIDISTVNGEGLIKNYKKFLFFMGCLSYLHYSVIRFIIQCGIARIDESSKEVAIVDQCGLVLIKLTIFLLRRETFMKLIWDINQLAKEINIEERKIWRVENMRLQLLTKAYLGLGWSTVICSVIFPLIRIAYDYRQNHGFIHHHPFAGIFPFDNGHILLFMLNFVLCFVYIYTILHLAAGINMLFCWYIYSISAHFCILRYKVERAALNLQNNNDASSFFREIGKLVQYHNRTLGLVDDLNGLFGETFFCEIVIGCFQICCIIYVLKTDENIFNMPYNILGIGVLLSELLVYCLCGEKLKEESLLLSNDFYLKLPWHSMSPREKKMMLLPLIRSQKLSVLNATFFQVERNLLVSVFKTAFSFNAFLSTIKEK